jgi:hypothetical protein
MHNSDNPPKNEEGIKLPSFTSTQEEIKRAVERGAIHRGELLIKVIASMQLDKMIDTIQSIQYDIEDFFQRKEELNISEEVLETLSKTDPPIPYPFYFSMPEYLIEYPNLVMYYRNVAMLSRKVMRGIQLPTDAYEDKGISPSSETAKELTRYFNGIISKFVLASGVTPNRHFEIALSNIGDTLGGISRNEVGRYSIAQIIHYLIIYWHQFGYIDSIQYTFKRNFDIEEDENHINNETQFFKVTPEMDITSFLKLAEDNRVKYQQITLNNGYQLLFDRQLQWQDQSDENKFHRIGADMISKSVSIDMVWSGEVKGGSDPAGSDEHWKTATQAINRILEAAEKSGRQKPKLSFLATILVERVAIEAQRWIDGGKLTSVYNLTKIAENPKELQKFLDDMTNFLGYSTTN